MIAPEKHVRYFPAAKFRGPRVLWAIEQALLAERFTQGRILVAEHSRQQSRHTIDHDRGREFAAAQYKISDGELFIRQSLGDPLVHAFVTSSQVQQLLGFSQP